MFRKATLLVLLAVAMTIQAQEANRRSKHRYVIVPPENLLLVIAAQPDCPLKFDHANLLISADGDGDWGAGYELRNQGTKSIATFSAALWTSYGSGGTFARSQQIKGEFILPGQIIREDDDEVVTLTNELREKLKLQGPMKAVVVLMIESIKFADGSSYDDKVTSDALVNFFSDMDSRANRRCRPN